MPINLPQYLRGYYVLTGEDINKDFLNKIYELDKICYAEPGILINTEKRFEKEKRQLVCVMKEDVLAGYMEFFPVTDKLYNEIIYTCNEIRDDDIEPFEIETFSKNKSNNIFIISIVTSPKFRDGETIKILTNEFISYINKLEAQGYKINSISATAISKDGEKFLKRNYFSFVREINHGYKTLICKGENLKMLKNNKRAF